MFSISTELEVSPVRLSGSGFSPRVAIPVISATPCGGIGLQAGICVFIYDDAGETKLFLFRRNDRSVLMAMKGFEPLLYF